MKKFSQKLQQKFLRSSEYQEIFSKNMNLPTKNKIFEKYSKILEKKFIIFNNADFFQQWDNFFMQFETECSWVCCHLNAFYFPKNNSKHQNYWKNFNKDEFFEDLKKFLQKIEENPEITHIWFYDDYLKRAEAIRFLQELENNFKKL